MVSDVIGIHRLGTLAIILFTIRVKTPNPKDNNVRYLGIHWKKKNRGKKPSRISFKLKKTVGNIVIVVIGDKKKIFLVVFYRFFSSLPLVSDLFLSSVFFSKLGAILLILIRVILS